MIRIGVIGAGYWGSKHLRVFHELQEAHLAAVCDLSPRNLDYVEHYYPNALRTSDYNELLESGVDAVVVATPVDTHFQLTKEALLAGKHVLVEKPLTSEVKAAQELVDLADEKGLTLMAGHTYQFHPAVEFLRELVDSGELGDLYYIDSARLNLGVFRTDVDVIWDLAPHDISIILFLLSQDPSWISVKATAHINPSLVEVSYVSLGFPNQILAHTHVSWLDPCKVRRLTLVGSKRMAVRRLTLVGSKRMAVFDEMSPTDQVRIYDKGASLNGNGSAPSVIQYRYGEVRTPFIPYAEPLKNECSHFLRCIESGERPRSDGREALRVISILEAAHQSLNRNGEQVMPEMPQVSQIVAAR